MVVVASNRGISSADERISVVTLRAAKPFRLKHERRILKSSCGHWLSWQVGMLRIVQLFSGPTPAEVTDERHGGE